MYDMCVKCGMPLEERESILVNIYAQQKAVDSTVDTLRNQLAYEHRSFELLCQQQNQGLDSVYLGDVLGDVHRSCQRLRQLCTYCETARKYLDRCAKVRISILEYMCVCPYEDLVFEDLYLRNSPRCVE